MLRLSFHCWGGVWRRLLLKQPHTHHTRSKGTSRSLFLKPNSRSATWRKRETRKFNLKAEWKSFRAHIWVSDAGLVALITKSNLNCLERFGLQTLPRSLIYTSALTLIRLASLFYPSLLQQLVTKFWFHLRRKKLQSTRSMSCSSGSPNSFINCEARVSHFIPSSFSCYAQLCSIHTWKGRVINQK